MAALASAAPHFLLSETCDLSSSEARSPSESLTLRPTLNPWTARGSNATDRLVCKHPLQFRAGPLEPALNCNGRRRAVRDPMGVSFGMRHPSRL